MSYSYQKGFSWPLALFAAVLVLVIVGLAAPFSIGFSRGGHSGSVVALNNAKAIAGGLNLFKQEYGSFPCEATRELLVKQQIENVPIGKSSNAYLAQLIVSGMIDSETYFSTPSVPGIESGDDLKTPGRLLAEGENGFGYVMTAGGNPLNDASAKMPLVITPLVRSGGGFRFDRGPYQGKYICGNADGTATWGEIDDDGTALTEEGADIFRAGPGSLFGDQIPVLTYPLVR